ncbi:pectinesterase inhibitor 1-like [Lotus japonicus]|uniref:pectinesterase inhibitor 1-like n=1 Tax=Lotus japonicus TaxID=34305 RepID=UPI0025873663|nr:pectinesterase inhibitor 1-like [Lotus japonicus]
MDYHAAKTCLLIISLISLADAVPSTRNNIHNVQHNLHDLRSELRSDLSAFCQKTTNPTLCAKTIQPHFLHNNLDPFKALEIEVEATLNQTKKTIAIISELLAKHDISKSLKGSLDTCKEQYDSIMDSIKETIDAIARKDVIEAKFKFSAVISFQSSCKDAFEGLDDFPIASDSDEVFQLGGNCLDIIADLEKAFPHHDAPVEESTPSAFSNIIGTLS